MKKDNQQEKGFLRTNNILMDIREAVISTTQNGEHISLKAYFQRVNSDTAVERIQDAIRQLVEARKNSKAYGQIANRRESLSNAFNESKRWVSEVIEIGGSAEAIDKAIISSITNRNIQQMQYGYLS